MYKTKTFFMPPSVFRNCSHMYSGADSDKKINVPLICLSLQDTTCTLKHQVPDSKVTMQN